MIFLIIENKSSKANDCLTKDLINSPRYELRKSPANTPTKDMLNRFKQAQINAATGGGSTSIPRSPLALSNLDKNSASVLVKKRKNVPKSTVATQTDESYLATHTWPFI